MRNSELVLNICCAVATGTKASSSVFMPRPMPDVDSTPMMRKRRSPTRTSRPTAGSAPNSSRRTLPPITITGDPCAQSSSGRKRPCASSKWRTSRYSAVVPTTTVSRSLPPAVISAEPTDTGATRSTACARPIARASSSVRSRGVLVTALAGEKPPVCVRPGSTITRFVPSEENWSIT